MFGVSPWGLLAALVAALSIAGGSFWAGKGWAEGRAAIAQQEAVAAAVAQKESDLAVARAVSASYQTVAALIERAGIQSRIEVSHEIERVEYRCLLPDSGRLLLDQAVERANAAAAGRPVGAVPGAGQPAAEGHGGAAGVHD